MIVKPEVEARFFEELVKDVEFAFARAGVHGRVPIRPDPRDGLMTAVSANDPIETPPETCKNLPESAVELCRRLMTFADRMVEEHRLERNNACEVLPAGLAWQSASNTEIDVVNDASLGCTRTQISVMVAVSARESRLKRQRIASEKVQTSQRGGPSISDLVSGGQ